MNRIFFALPGNEDLTKSLCERCQGEYGVVSIRQFPDGETYLKIESDVQDKEAIIVCTLCNPDPKLLSLYYLSQTLKDLGVKSICLIAPYLAYMRQDKRFQPGEGVTSVYFAKLISTFVDSLITIDPHLHRFQSLSEIYSIPAKVVNTTQLIAGWIKKNIERPLLIGPDSESKQWVSEIAKQAEAPYVVLEKMRINDSEVKITVPQIDKYNDYTPVLVDDIISTAKTMLETINHLKESGMMSPACIGIHGIFANNAFFNLKNSGINQLVTCNTIVHSSNQIFIDELLADTLRSSSL